LRTRRGGSGKSGEVFGNVEVEKVERGEVKGLVVDSGKASSLLQSH
jgi:hypothetical protein